MTRPMVAALVDLVLPTTCAGCDAPGTAWCERCAVRVAAAGPVPVVPRRPLPDLPPVTAAGPYTGALREAVNAYKEHGRHALAALLLHGEDLNRFIGGARAVTDGSEFDSPEPPRALFS